MKFDYSLFNRSGIYKITNIANGKCYIGSSCNLYNRIYEHFKYLRLNRHANPKLQNAYNKYGLENFKWEIMIFGNCDYCLKLEQLCFDVYKPEYNVYLRAEMINRKLSQETKDKIGIKSKQKYIDNPQLKEDFINRQKGKLAWNSGKTGIYSKETLLKMKESAKKQDISHLYSKESMLKKELNQYKVKVNLFNKQKELVYTFNSIKEAVLYLNIPFNSRGNISSGLNKNKIRFGFYWEKAL